MVLTRRTRVFQNVGEFASEMNQVSLMSAVIEE
jgi:hypothetical protein